MAKLIEKTLVFHGRKIQRIHKSNRNKSVEKPCRKPIFQKCSIPLFWACPFLGGALRSSGQGATFRHSFRRSPAAPCGRLRSFTRPFVPSQAMRGDSVSRRKAGDGCTSLTLWQLLAPFYHIYAFSKRRFSFRHEKLLMSCTSGPT